MRLNGRDFRPSTPLAAFKAGVAYVPADRYTDGLVPAMTLRENLYLNPTVAVAAERGEEGVLAGITWLRGERSVARTVLRRYNVRPAHPERETSTLSGGNAQKLLLAKWLSLKPELLILNEPTTGVDVGAREQIYSFVRDAAASGTTCLVITSDFEEVAQLCHRALVFSRGRLAREIAGDELNPQAVVSAALETVGSA
jgi:ribose transport system ATP-binding protein